MESHAPAPFEPAKIDAHDLERPVTRNQRAMPDHAIKDLRAQRILQAQSFSLWNPKTKARLKLYPIGAVLSMSLVYWLLVSATVPLVAVLIFAVFGAYLAVMRPTGLHAGAITLLAYMGAAYLATGGFSLFAAIVFAILGAAVGIAEEAKLSL